MTDPAEEYRNSVAECIQAANVATREDVRATLLAMAQRWIDLADRADRNRHLRAAE